MSNSLVINKIIKHGGTIIVEFTASGRWNDFLDSNRLTNEYNENVENVPDSIAVIPVICNILPIAWVYNLTIEVPEIDKIFFDSIPRILDGYKKMYPNFSFSGGIKASRILSNSYDVKRNAVLFSGGVDATTTTYRHLDELSDLITIFGSDIELSDEEGIENANLLNDSFSKKHGLHYEKVYSTFRSFINENNLQNTELVKGHSWWHDFQHGVGLLGLVAPLSYIRGYGTIFIASSYHKKQKGKYVCASDPLIDNKLKYGNTVTNHDGYELTRQDKIEFICKYAKKHNLKPYLRVCWISDGGKNCCHCEKCRRTYLGILAAKFDPKDFGLDFTPSQQRRAISWCRRHFKYNFSHDTIPYYQSIQDGFIKNYSEEEVPKALKWILSIKIGGKPTPLSIRAFDRIQEKIRHGIKRAKILFRGQ